MPSPAAVTEIIPSLGYLYVCHMVSIGSSPHLAYLKYQHRNYDLTMLHVMASGFNPMIVFQGYVLNYQNIFINT